jgi:transcriptional regulator with XRE-family HTH domain
MDEALLLAKFGARVRRERLALGLSQEKLALDCGLDRTYISSLERGKRNVSLINIHKLATALGIPAAELVLTAGGVK